MKLIHKRKSTLTGFLFLGLLLTFTNVSAGSYQTYKVASYSYAQFSTSGDSSIDLYDYNNKKIGILVFLPLEEDLLPNAAQDINGLVRLYYSHLSLSTVVDLLRNENPIVLRYWTGRGNNSHIGTAKRELVGEGE